MLTIDRAYFELTGGLERWLYRLVRKHGGRQEGGWSFDLKHLHAKSGSLSPLKHFTYDLREIVRRERLPALIGFVIERDPARRRAPQLLLPIPLGIRSRPLINRRGLATAPEKGCEFISCYRGISSRAIRNPILVLSGTGIGRNVLASATVEIARNFS